MFTAGFKPAQKITDAFGASQKSGNKTINTSRAAVRHPAALILSVDAFDSTSN